MAQESPSRKRSNPQPKKKLLERKGLVLGIIVVIILASAIGIYAVYPKGQSTNHKITVVNPVAVINTSYGTIRVELYMQQMPLTTGNFIHLVSDGFYNGLVFHRVIHNFMIQGGGFFANGTQRVDPYGSIRFESNATVLHVDGAISMASTAVKVGGSSQFFICDGAQPSLDGNYAAFGKVVSGMDVLRSISALDPDHTTTKYGSYQNWPVNDVIINSITIDYGYPE